MKANNQPPPNVLKLPLASYDWALRHLIAEGDTDLFPTPFEIQAIKYLWKDLRKQLAGLDLANYAWRGGRRFVVPKSMLAFRIATQLDPLDSIVISAIIKKVGAKLEASRLPVEADRVFSYRLSPSSDGRLYSSTTSWHDFWAVSLRKSRQANCKFVVVADIADFYNQVYHHSIENHLEGTGIPTLAAKAIKRFLQALTDKVSRGVPVGPHVSHILAECALDATDRSLLSHGYDFCRYVDDIHIFVADEDAATGALYDLAQILDSQQRLMLQNEKTRIVSAEDFAKLAQDALIDRPATDEERAILTIISSKTSGDPYRDVSLTSLSTNELNALSRDVLERLLSHYMDAQNRPEQLGLPHAALRGPRRQGKIDYARLSWLIRRLAQLGAPGGINFLLSRLSELGPILGPIARYISAAVPHYEGDRHLIGEKIVRALDLAILKKSPYLQTVLLDVLATLPELDHVDSITARYSESDPLIRREILRVAASGNRGDWLRDRKNEFRGMDPWSRRAFVLAARALPPDEAKFWLQSVTSGLSAMEKVIARYAFQDREGKTYKLGIIEIVK